MEKAMKRAIRPTLVKIWEEKVGFIASGTLLGVRVYGSGESLIDALEALFRNYRRAAKRRRLRK